MLLAYATQAVMACTLAQRLYPVRYEGGRLLRVVLAGVGATVAARALPAMPPLAGFLARGTTTVLAYAGLLWMTGFFRATERAFLREMIGRARRRSSAAARPSPIDVA